jgi:elongation factor Tu
VKAELLVRVSMKTESEGGRHGPFEAGYCPHFIAEGSSDWLGVRVSSCAGPVAPGETAEIRVELLYHPKLDYSALYPGSKFKLVEGPRTIGDGLVLEDLQEPRPT